jgi:hypothetical protein
MNLLDKYSTIAPSEWAERNIHLDYGRFDPANHPLLVDPLNAMCETRGAVVGLIGSVQAVKTLTAQIGQLYGLHIEPGRAAMYDLTESALREFSDDKFTPLIDSTDAIMEIVPEQPYRRTKFYTSTNYGAIRLLSANVLAARNSKTLERITADECWAYGENWLDQIRDRQSSYPWSWQMFLPSSGQTRSSELDEMWERSTKKTWHVKCDCCGELVPYIWRAPAVGDDIPVGGMRWASKADYTQADGKIDWKALGDSVFYECQLCGGRMDPSIGQQIERNATGRYIAMNPDADGEFDFYHYNAMAHIPWRKLVEQFKLAQMEREHGNLESLENFIRKRLAEPWSETDYISADVSHSARGGYMLGDTWSANGQFAFCTIDVQKDSFYFVIRSWAMVDGFLRSRLLDRGHVVTAGEIRAACDRWKIPQHPLGSGGACRVFIDGNYNTTNVQRIAYENGWMVFRGDAAKDYMNQDGIRRIYSDLKVVDAFDGTGAAGGNRVGQFYISKQSAKNRLSLIRSLKDNHGNLLWTHADDAGEEYEKQINAWAKITKTKPDGSVFYDWINTNRDDHYGDCEFYQAVCAAMCKNLAVAVDET